MVPITGLASSFLEILKNPISIQIKIKYIPFSPSLFLCLLGQPELCGSYHLLQSCFSFFIFLHGQPEPFGSCHLLQSCFSIFFHLHGQTEPFGSSIILLSCSFFLFCLHGQPEVFASDHLLQSSTHFHHLASIFTLRLFFIAS